MRSATISVALWSSSTCSATPPTTCRGSPTGWSSHTGKGGKMTIELNHTIIPAKDKWASAKFLADILNIEAGPEWGYFVPVKTGNGVTLDFSDSEGFRPQHYAFLVSDSEFDAALARIRASGVKHYANFRRERPGEINHLYGGRGVYFDDPNGHLLELITRPYGPTPEGG